MAEKKAARSAKMYGKGPRIEDKDVETKIEAGGAPEPAKTVSSGSGDTKSGGDAKGDVMAGTDGVETHHQHSGERMEMHHRHERERGDMMHRHEREHMMRATGHHHEKHEAMHERHESEMRAMHTRHEGEHRAMHDRHEDMQNGPNVAVKMEDRSPDKAGNPGETKT